MKMIVKRLVKEGRAEEILKVYEELVTLTRQEDGDGCISYALYQDAENPRIFVMMEEWKNQEALDLHLQTEHYKRLGPKLNELTEKKFAPEQYIRLI